ncbi:DUF6760 family protein [Streptomyces sp. NPDC051555]|uniref:DUF6760 family protein n=1 Tax=Streptomyces sp. NPDC051555 TaxID=3365657 RepID=UPI0037B2EABD
MTFPQDRLWEEITYLAYYLHWSPDTLTGLEHSVRQRYVREVARMNTRISQGGRP